MADAKHSEQTVADGIHIAHAFEVASIAARDALSLVAADVGKIVKVASPLRYDLIVSQAAGVGTFTRIDSIDYVAAVQAADLTLTTVTPGTDATDLFLFLPVGTWVVEVRVIFVTSGSSTDGYRTDWDFSGTSSSIRSWWLAIFADVAGGTTFNSQTRADLGTDYTIVGVGTRTYQVISTLKITVSVAGTLAYRAAKNTDVSTDSTLKANSYLIARREP